MALILSLDSTTSICSAAIHRDGELIDHTIELNSRVAASKLGVMVKNLLEKVQINSKAISAIAVSSGPGSYTGLRIATSTAKGLCFALGVPLIAVNSLLVLTKQLIGKMDCDFFCPMLDARRMEVYCVLVNTDLEIMGKVEAKELTENSFYKELETKRILFFGDGAKKFRTLVNHKNAFFVDDIQPRAVELGQIAFRLFENRKFENLESFEPYYLKDFIFKK